MCYCIDQYARTGGGGEGEGGGGWLDPNLGGVLGARAKYRPKQI